MILFHPVKNSDQKLQTVLDIAIFHLHKKESLLILVPDPTALAFVDTLLWKASFLPHPTPLLDIALQPKESHALLNLCPTAFLEKIPFRVIHELDDSSTKEKAELSKLRYHTYKEAHCAVAMATDACRFQYGWFSTL